MQLIKKALNYYNRAYCMGHFPNILQIIFTKKKLIAYYGFLGDGNFGDELVYEATRKLSRNVVLVPINRYMPFLWRVFLIMSPRRFKGFIIGGGTLVGNTPYRPSFKILKPKNVPLFLHGVGVHKNYVEDFWSSILTSNIFGGVRGPLSQVNLKSINIQPPIIGDAAMYLFCSDNYINKPRPTQSKNILINFGTHKSIESLQTSRISIENFIVIYHQKGFNIKFLPFHIIDQKIGEELLLKYPFVRLLKIPKSFNEAIIHFKDCNYAIGERLHFNVMATLTNCPFLSINYDKKHHDFLESMNISFAGSQINKVTFDLIEENFLQSGKTFNWAQINAKLLAFKNYQKQEFNRFITTIK